MLEKINESLYNSIHSQLKDKKLLCIGGAGSIGAAFILEVLKYELFHIDIVDISENDNAELARRVRINFPSITTKINFITLDVGSILFSSLFESNGPYDYVANLSALKHVRSEQNIYTLIRMIEVNLLNINKILNLIVNSGYPTKFFSVSTDKASSPINFMGASKRAMEILISQSEISGNCSMARFANVRFSKGSLLDNFVNRVTNREPITIPADIYRYFIDSLEAARISIYSMVFINESKILIPSIENLALIPRTFSDEVQDYLFSIGKEPVIVKTVSEGFDVIRENTKYWPIILDMPFTTGEKKIEVFKGEGDVTEDFLGYKELEVLTPSFAAIDSRELTDVFAKLNKMTSGEEKIDKVMIRNLLMKIVTDFTHDERNMYLNDKH